MRKTVMTLLFLVTATAQTPSGLFANPMIQAAATQPNSLNDLIRELPVLSYAREAERRRLSAIQEMLYLHESRMRGEGLSPELAVAFSANYSAIISALVEDRISDDYGRELLSVHRQLLERTHLWMAKRVRDENFPAELIENLAYFLSELNQNAVPLEKIPASMRTPLINGYQVWVGELLAWGCECGKLSPGYLSHIEVKAAELERFEGYYKKDGVLQVYEREQLHGRFLRLTRETIEVLGRGGSILLD